MYLRLNNGTSEVVNVSMEELEQQLNPDCFFRANRQYIINVEHVLFLGNYFGGKLIVHLKGYPKTEIQVSKEKLNVLRNGLTGKVIKIIIVKVSNSKNSILL